MAGFIGGRVVNTDYWYLKEDSNGYFQLIGNFSKNINFLCNNKLNSKIWSSLYKADITISESDISASYTFYNCTGLSEVIINPENISNVSYSFYNCSLWDTIIDKNHIDDKTNLLEFTALQYAEEAFYNCGFETTKISLPSLVNAPGMFTGSYLRRETAEYILDSLPSYTNGGTHKIGMSIEENELPEDTNELDIFINKATSKGWTLTIDRNIAQ